MIDKNIDCLESDKDFAKMAQDIKEGDSANVTGLAVLNDYQYVVNTYQVSQKS